MITKQGDKFSVSGGRLTIKRDGEFAVFKLTPYEMRHLAGLLLQDAKQQEVAAQVASLVPTGGDSMDEQEKHYENK
jgi:hypothetical protein